MLGSFPGMGDDEIMIVSLLDILTSECACFDNLVMNELLSPWPPVPTIIALSGGNLLTSLIGLRTE